MKRKKQMRGIVFCLVLLFLFPCSAQAASKKIRITAETAAVRVQPDSESQVIRLMSQGQELDLLDVIDQWYRVSVFINEKGIEKIGYVHSSLAAVEIKDKLKPEKTGRTEPEKDKTESSVLEVGLDASRKRTWVGLKLRGGVSYILANDINEGTRGFDDIWRDELSSSGASLEGELTPFHLQYNLEGDIIFYVFPNVGIGFGSGYIFGKQNNQMLLKLPAGEGSWIIRPELEVIPLRAGLYFLIPIGGGSYFTLDAGAGWYRVDYSWYWRGENPSGYWEEISQQATAQDIGYQAGLGFEISLGPFLALLIEGRARYAEIGGSEGTIEYSNSTGGSDKDEGKLYFWKEVIGAKKYTFVFINETGDPSFTGLSAAEFVREAVIDLSGLSLQAGFKIKF